MKRRSAVLVTMSVIAPLLAVTDATPAHATFPGVNGRLAFTSTQDGGSRHIFEATAHGIIDLTGATSPAIETQPEFSPDGHELVFTRYEPGKLPNTEIYLMTASGKARIALTDTGTGNGDPTWSPDGRRIAFEADRGATPDIYVMKSDGTDVHRVTNDAASESQLAWSPTGTRIAFVSSPAGGGDKEIDTIHPDGSALADVSNDPDAYDLDPNWSPNGRKLVYSAGTHPSGSVGGDLWIMNADGTGQQPLEHEDNGYSSGNSPAWSPDGTSIAFAANNGTGYQHIWYVAASGGQNAELVTNNSNGNPVDAELDWQQGPTHVAPPRTRLTHSSSSSAARHARFTFTAPAAFTYECALRRGHRKAAFRTCPSPTSYSHLKTGRYRFLVRAIGAGGKDRSAAVDRFRIRPGVA